MRDLAERYNPLCLSLNISGFNRLKLIELKALRNPLAQAVAFASVLSVGDFGVIALFGNEDFRTLPFYLYQQIGAYRNADAAVTALILFYSVSGCLPFWNVCCETPMIYFDHILYRYQQQTMNFHFSVAAGEKLPFSARAARVKVPCCH